MESPWMPTTEGPFENYDETILVIINLLTVVGVVFFLLSIILAVYNLFISKKPDKFKNFWWANILLAVLLLIMIVNVFVYFPFSLGSILIGLSFMLAQPTVLITLGFSFFNLLAGDKANPYRWHWIFNIVWSILLVVAVVARFIFFPLPVII